jgi:hypothetical protein
VRYCIISAFSEVVLIRNSLIVIKNILEHHG